MIRVSICGIAVEFETVDVTAAVLCRMTREQHKVGDYYTTETPRTRTAAEILFGADAASGPDRSVVFKPGSSFDVVHGNGERSTITVPERAPAPVPAPVSAAEILQFCAGADAPSTPSEGEPPASPGEPAPARKPRAKRTPIVSGVQLLEQLEDDDAAPGAKCTPETRAAGLARKSAIVSMLKAGPVTLSQLVRAMASAKTKVYPSGIDERQKLAAVQNSIQQLRAHGHIARAGQNWVLVDRRGGVGL